MKQVPFESLPKIYFYDTITQNIYLIHVTKTKMLIEYNKKLYSIDKKFQFLIGRLAT